jgi:hypothetical protein
MKTRWASVALVVIAAFGIIGYKHHRLRAASGQLAQAFSSGKPEIVLVVDPREAGSGDNCAEIIRLVRAAAERGVAVRELSPESESPLLKRYRVLTVPTLLILDPDGNVVSRYEGEESSTVQEIRDRVVSFSGVKR